MKFRIATAAIATGILMILTMSIADAAPRPTKGTLYQHAVESKIAKSKFNFK